MPLDAYSLCPGGTGKKLKFCCTDLTADLQKIERMIEGEQYMACLKQLERLEETTPGRACLLSTKTLVLRLLGHTQEAAATAAAFLQQHPDNPIALAETALTAALGNEERAGVESLSKAISAGNDTVQGRVYEAMGVVARRLAAQGHMMASRALCLVQLALRRDDQRAMSLLVQLNSSAEVPLLMKEDRTLQQCADDAPFKDAFQEAAALADRARWLDAASRFEALAEQHPDESTIWRNLSLLRAWLADVPGCVAALEKFASLDVPLEDAAEAEALARILSDDPFGDAMDVVAVRYDVEDADALFETLCGAPRAAQSRRPPGVFDGEGPPPRAVFFLSDRPMPQPQQEPSIDSIPRILCEAELFDRQTDRPARLELPSLVSTDSAEVKALLVELAGEQLGSEPQEELVGQVSATRELLMRTWRLPPGRTNEFFRELTSTHVEESLLETWPERPLGMLDGKSPAEAASDGQDLRVKLSAAVILVDTLVQETRTRFDCNRLRRRLGLLELGPIDPRQTPVEEIPLLRLDRVEVENLSNEDLLRCYYRAATFGAQQALIRFARAVIERPDLGRREARLHAYQQLARLADSSEESLRLVDEGREETKAAGQSCASWDLFELSLRFGLADGAEASRLLNHLHNHHWHEPGVPDAVTDMLIEVGLLRPDGSPAADPAAAAGQQPGIVVPGQAGAEPGKLWTPESQQPAGQKGKLWTPGMD